MMATMVPRPLSRLKKKAMNYGETSGENVEKSGENVEKSGEHVENDDEIWHE